MKCSFKKVCASILLLVSFNISTAQKISLADLHTMSANKNWETSNRYLLSKGWEYYNSNTGDGEEYNTITWSFRKSRYDDKKADGWLYIYTYEGLPNKVMYRFRVKEFYTNIKNQLSVNGYKLIDEEILNERVIAKYSNANYILELTYSRESDDEEYNALSFTAYEITVYKKGGVYDPNNGKKQEYDADGNLEAEYFLKDGKINGDLKFFNPDGTIHRTTFFKNGNEEGLSTEYIYLDSSKVLIGKYKGPVVNGKKNGKWMANLIKDEKETNISFSHYVDGVEEGDFQSVSNDSVIYGKRKNGLLEGKYLIFRDLKKFLVGGYIETDSTKLKKTTIGYYTNNKRTGYWKNYDLTETLISEGNYADSLKTGKWKFYNPSIVDKDDVVQEYSGKLIREETYENDMLNGPSIRYSYFDDVVVPCQDDKDKICTESKFISVLEKCNYIDGVLNGDYELRNDKNEILYKGIYIDGKENGKWLERNESPIIKWKGETNEIGNFVFGKKQGKWERFDDENLLLESYTYFNDVIEDEHLLMNKGRIAEKRKFLHGEMIGLTVLDNAENPITDYSLSDVTETKYICKKTERAADGFYTATYHINRSESDIVPFTFKIDFEALPDNVKTLEGFYQKESLDHKLLEEGTYKNNTKIGTWTTNYYDQNIRTEFEYNLYGIVQKEFYFDLKKQEPFSGEFLFKTPNADTIEERKIKDGLRHGTTRFKDANDKTIKKESYKEGVLKE